MTATPKVRSGDPSTQPPPPPSSPPAERVVQELREARVYSPFWQSESDALLEEAERELCWRAIGVSMRRHAILGETVDCDCL